MLSWKFTNFLWRKENFVIWKGSTNRHLLLLCRALHKSIFLAPCKHSDSKKTLTSCMFLKTLKKICLLVNRHFDACSVIAWCKVRLTKLLLFRWERSTLVHMLEYLICSRWNCHWRIRMCGFSVGIHLRENFEVSKSLYHYWWVLSVFFFWDKAWAEHSALFVAMPSHGFHGLWPSEIIVKWRDANS